MLPGLSLISDVFSVLKCVLFYIKESSYNSHKWADLTFIVLTLQYIVAHPVKFQTLKFIADVKEL